MAERVFTLVDLDALRQWDTPTICNALEIIVPERRAIGFTVEPMIAIDPKLAPVAALADRHFKVRKRVAGDLTTTSIQEVAGQDRVEELAEMLAGTPVTDAARDSARALLDRSKETAQPALTHKS